VKITPTDKNNQKISVNLFWKSTPVMDGVEFANLIRNSAKPDIPIIAITAYPGNKAIEGNLFNSIIGKPFNLVSLKKIISQHLES
jgi:CheY-like chemotaxis protein